MHLTVDEIARMTGGIVQGDGARAIEGASGLQEATEKDISFLGNKKYLSFLEKSRAGAVLVSPDCDVKNRTAIVLKNPQYGWAKVLEILSKERLQHPADIHPASVVSKTAKIGKNVSLGAYAVVEDGACVGDNTIVYPHVFIGANTQIGSDCLIYPHVTIRERVVIGDRCVFQPGAVIGADGFGFTLYQGKHYKVPQVGGVEIGDDVEIQANTTIDRAAAGMTRIGKGTKIDNLVQIAHNVETGENCLIAAMTGVAGSVKIGNYVTLAAQVGVAGHLKIEDSAVVGAQGGVTNDVESKAVVWGTPAHPLKDELKAIASMRKLPRILEEIKSLKKTLGIGS